MNHEKIMIMRLFFTLQRKTSCDLEVNKKFWFYSSLFKKEWLLFGEYKAQDKRVQMIEQF
ncbi:hypothetical protein [Allobaculum stercoricanis]|uniref:hypothetical protein n=1 Tax=Allobaculum stercoricanis TaxID=174709 RepID=UPI0029428B1C|nr:hypothetical protein [Allobaculum stercoricanis]